MLRYIVAKIIIFHLYYYLYKKIMNYFKFTTEGSITLFVKPVPSDKHPLGGRC